MGTLGTDLRQARETAGITRQELSARTKIRPSLLEAMERDDFGQLPAGVLGRGHLRAYAQEVRLDPDRIVQRFRDEYVIDTPPPAHVRQPSPDPDRHRAWPVGLLVGVAVLAAWLFVPQLMNQQTADPDPEAIGTAGELPGTAGETAGPVAVTNPSPADPSSAVTTSARNNLALELRPTATVWVEARADGRRVLYTLAHVGERSVVQARDEIHLRLGDAAAVQYSINGKPGRPFGRPGEVRDVQITRENYATFAEVSRP